MTKIPGTHGQRARSHGKEAAAAVAAAGAAVVGGKIAWDRLSSPSDEHREFRLSPDEAVPDGIRRIARGQLDNAIEELEAVSDRNIGEPVHETRKRLKRLRACVRLARGALGDETYRTENSSFRDLGRLLSGARDARVLVETLDSVTARFRDELQPEAAARLRSQLAEEHERAIEALKGDRALIETVIESLKGARQRTAGWSFESDGFDPLAPGLQRIYRRGRRALRSAEAETTMENLHEWRKRVKDYWHASQMLRAARPGRMKKLAKRAHHLSDLLGEYHDLAVLRDCVESRPGSFDDDFSRATLVALIDRRQLALQQEAFELGRLLYKQPPKKLVRTIERGWQAHVPKQPQRAAAS